MTDADLARLRARLDLVTYISPKPGVFAASPSLVRPGLVVVRAPGAGEDE